MPVKEASTACFSNNKNAWQVGISLRHNVLYKEMFFCKTSVIDMLRKGMQLGCTKCEMKTN